MTGYYSANIDLLCLELVLTLSGGWGGGRRVIFDPRIEDLKYLQWH